MSDNGYNVVAIDPGIKVAAWAKFSSTGTLFEAKLVKHETSEQTCQALLNVANLVDIVVCEKMHVYGKKLYAGNHLIDISIMTGRLRPDFLYTYQQWAGSLKEEILWNRIMTRLSDKEKTVLPKSLGPHKDVLAAVGIGLHHFGRLKPNKGY